MKFKDGSTVKESDVMRCLQIMEHAKLEDLDAIGFNPRTNYLWAVCMHQWIDVKRPFFNVYPSVLDGLSKTNLDIDPGTITPSVIHRLGVVEIRTPEDHPLPNFFLSIVPEKVLHDGCRGVPVLEIFVDDKEQFIWQTVQFGKKPNLGPSEIAQRNADYALTGNEREILTDCLRIAFGVMLLAADSTYLDPILLARDRNRVLDDDGRATAVRRAIKRGVHGFTIGKHVEVSPHVRKPHLAIRWTGKGRTIPKLVPIKGSVINRKLIDKVPTGYDG